MRDIEDVGRSDCQGRTSCAAGCAAPCARRLGDTGQENKPSAPTTATQQNSDQHEEDEEVLDVVVIGAGVIGCSVARELSRYMLNVLVIEKHQDVSQGASKANSGVVHGGYDARHGTVKSELSLRGNQMFPQLESELHFGFKPIGSLVLAFNDEDVHQLDLLMENGRKNGVTSLKLLDVKELRALEPNVSLAAKRALYCPDAGIASPYEYTIALAENAAHNGVGFLLGEAVVSIRRVEAGSAADAEQGCTAGSGHGARMFVVETSSGRVVRTRCVVNCAGLFADELSRAAGAEPLEISPRKGEYIILDRTQGATVRHVLFQAPTRKWGKGILVTPTVAGNLMLGPSAKDVRSKYNVSTSVEELAYVAWAARRTVPSLDLGAAITSFSGLRAKPSGKDFIIRESEWVPGFIQVAGIESPGLTSSPAIAQRVRGLVEAVLTPTLAPDGKDRGGSSSSSSSGGLVRDPNFDPVRRPIIVSKGSEFEGTIDDPDPAKNIICRCERVTEAEIRDALDRSFGTSGGRLTATDSVKWRTRAGMGPCQGNFCRPRVEALMQQHARDRGLPAVPVTTHVRVAPSTSGAGGESDSETTRDRVVKGLLARL